MTGGGRRPLVCLVTDRRRLTPNAADDEQLRRLGEQVRAAIDAGIDLIQIRERDLDGGRLVEAVGAVTDYAAGTASRVFVNDRADVAAAAGAAGVHLRGDAAPIARWRTAYPNLLVGKSVHSTGDAAAHSDADYLWFGHVFASTSKRDVPPAGLVALRDCAAAVSGPVVAIGGVSAANASSCVAAGAAGIAAIGAFIPPPDAAAPAFLRRAVAELRAALENC